MQVAIFTVCKKAFVRNGLLTISDAFSNLLVHKLPTTMRFAIATRLYFHARDEGAFEGVIKLIDPDGLPLLQTPFQIRVAIHEADGTGLYIDSVGGFQATFRTAGEHQFHIGPADRQAAIFPFYVAVKAS